jgi:hypothetical protein
MPIRRILAALGLGGGAPPGPEHGFLARVRRELNELGAERVEFLAAFAGQLARVALADATLSKEEEASIARLLRERAHLDKSDARLIVDLMHHEAETLRGLQHHLLNRAVNERATAASSQPSQVVAGLSDGIGSPEESLNPDRPWMGDGRPARNGRDYCPKGADTEFGFGQRDVRCALVGSSGDATTRVG